MSQNVRAERKTCSFAAETGIFGIYKTNYVVFTTEFVGESAETPAVRGNGVESAVKRARGYITCSLPPHFNGTFTGYNGGACGKLAPERPRGAQNVQLRRVNGCFRNFQNELRCFYNGIRRRNRQSTCHTRNSVRFSPILCDVRAAVVCPPIRFRFRCKNNGIGELAAVWSVPRLRRRAGVFSTVYYCGGCTDDHAADTGVFLFDFRPCVNAFFNRQNPILNRLTCISFFAHTR